MTLYSHMDTIMKNDAYKHLAHLWEQKMTDEHKTSTTRFLRLFLTTFFVAVLTFVGLVTVSIVFVSYPIVTFLVCGFIGAYAANTFFSRSK